MTVDNINDLPKFVLIEIFKNLNSKYVCQDVPRNSSYFHNYCYDSTAPGAFSMRASDRSISVNKIEDPSKFCGVNAASQQPQLTGQEQQLQRAQQQQQQQIKKHEQHEQDLTAMCIYLNNIINLSLVCKLWAKQIVPISSCCVVKVVTRRQMMTIYKYMTEGIMTDGARCIFSTIKFHARPNAIQPKDYRLLLSHCDSIRSISFDKNQLSFCDTVVISKHIRETSTLAELKMPGSFDCKGFMLFCEALRVNQSLTLLDISSNPMSTESVIAITDTLKTNRTLTLLDMSFNAIGVNGGLIAEMLRYNTTLRSLFLIGNELDDDSVTEIAETLRTKNSSLVDISLSENDFGDDVGAELGCIFTQNKTLLGLDLSFNQLGDGTALALAESLAGNNTLTSLNLSDCSLAESGCELFQALHANTTLSQLVLWSCDLTSDCSKEELAALLRTNQSITSISLGYNDLTSADVTTLLSSGLCHNNTLRVVCLNNNHIDGPGGIALANYLENNTSLIELSLFDNLIDNVAAIHFLIALTRNHNVRKLCLGSNRICPNISVMFKKIVQYNTPVCPNQKQHWISAKHQFMWTEVSILQRYVTNKCGDAVDQSLAQIQKLQFDLQSTFE
eukprot:gene13408-15792_t